jgi:hypothetical protein
VNQPSSPRSSGVVPEHWPRQPLPCLDATNGPSARTAGSRRGGVSESRAWFWVCIPSSRSSRSARGAVFFGRVGRPGGRPHGSLQALRLNAGRPSSRGCGDSPQPWSRLPIRHNPRARLRGQDWQRLHRSGPFADTSSSPTSVRRITSFFGGHSVTLAQPSGPHCRFGQADVTPVGCGGV